MPPKKKGTTVPKPTKVTPTNAATVKGVILKDALTTKRANIKKHAKMMALNKAIQERMSKTKAEPNAEPTAKATKTTTTSKKPVSAPVAPTISSREEPDARANTSRKRKSPSAEGDDHGAPVVKKAKAGPPNTKRKAAAVADEESQQPKKKARTEAASPSDPKKNSTKPRGAAATKRTVGRPKTVAKKSPATPKAGGPKAANKPALKLKLDPQINFAPTETLDVFIFGSGESGELGLGNKKIDGKKPVNVKRPRIHPLLSAETVGVVQIACGGMHSVALTKDNKILTWGVNDQGALGRDTTWDGGLRDADADADSDDDNGDDFEALNPVECTPAEVSQKNIAPGVKFAKVIASDSASFALTEDGHVYGWGTFRSTDGILGFTKDILVQYEPTLLESKKIVDIAAGNNHVMTLDTRGKVETWGAPEQNQLGRRVVQRDMRASALRPGGLSFKRGVKIVKIACGSYHSFAIDDQGHLYSWGLNSFGELGIDYTGNEDGAIVLEPTLVKSLADFKIAQVCGGEHHSIARTEDGKLLVWGRIDGNQTGLTKDKFLPHNTIFDEHLKPRILKTPAVHEGFPEVTSVTCGTDNCFAITRDGKAYSWGFSANYQTGQGEQPLDVEVPTLIDNSAVHDRRILSAGAGGQFSLLTSAHVSAA